jgi:DNA-binding transcriptional ArsR family regulator
MSRASALIQKDEQLDAVFHALADTTRRRLLDRLSRGPAPVTELAAPFSISLAAISKHLDVLEQAGVVRRQRDGRFQRCYLTPQALDSAGKFIEHYRPFWENSLAQLAEFLEGGSPSPPPSRAKKRGKRRE